jgi:sulfur carrier protein
MMMRHGKSRAMELRTAKGRISCRTIAGTRCALQSIVDIRCRIREGIDMPAQTLTLVLNGVATDVVLGGATIADLVAELGLAGKRIAVERNGEIVSRSRYAATTLDRGDRLEIVAAVGGG